LHVHAIPTYVQLAHCSEFNFCVPQLVLSNNLIYSCVALC